MQSFLKKYSELLDKNENHLNYEIIARYINHYNNLSEKEKKFIETHLAHCEECLGKYNIVFDEDLEANENNYNIKFERLKNDSDGKNIFHFYNDETKIHFIVHLINNSIITFSFIQIPKEFEHQKMKLIFSNSNLILRINSIQKDKTFNFKISNFLNLNTFNNIEVGILLVQDINFSKRKFSHLNKYISYSIAASILIILGISLYFLLQPRRNVQLQNKQLAIDTLRENRIIESEKKADSITLQENKITKESSSLFAQDFVENSLLENFVGRNIRGEEYLEILSPKNSDTLKIPILFKWRIQDSTNNFILKIINNKNEIVWEKISNDNEIEFMKQMKSGLYYWKLEINDELKYIGKFYIK